MDLISPEDRLEARAAWQDVMDTFIQLPVIFIQRTNQLAVPFNENRQANKKFVAYQMLALTIEEHKDDSTAQVKETKDGYIDLSEGIFYLNYKKLKEGTPSFIDSKGFPVFKTNVDTFYAWGREMTIIGVNLVGPWESDYQLVKVAYKLQLKNSFSDTDLFDGIYDSYYANTYQ